MSSMTHGNFQPRHLGTQLGNDSSDRPPRKLPGDMDKLEADFGAYQNQVTAALVATTRAAGQVSAGDLSFHRSTSPAIAKGIDEQNMRLLRLTNRLLRNVSSHSKVPSPPKLQTLEHVEDNWRGVIDVIDDLLEKADRNLDEFTGVIRSVEPSLKPVSDSQSAKLKGLRDRFPTIYDNHRFPKPQENFAVKPNNFEQGPWKPLLRKKPHASEKLDQSLKIGLNGCYLHPYQTEIKDFFYPPFVYKLAEPIRYTDPGQVPVEFVDTEDAVDRMLGELRSAREIAVDLEHHETHSYYGIVSLMQISTRDKDWVVDTLQPWRENLQKLNKVFADRNILKVFHGSNSDMIWLQRDFGLYVVGLFDTMHAATALNLPGKGLKYLLQTYANFITSKRYQIADWRVRPLLPGMLEYARSDTHYLLFVYDQLRNLLIERSTKDNNLIDYVLEASRREALQCYTRVSYESGAASGPDGWQSKLLRRPMQMNKQQFAVYRALHHWRDLTARTMDESASSILPIRQLNNLTSKMPRTVGSLMKEANPVTKAVQQDANKLVDIIKKATEEGKDGISVQEAIEAIQKPDTVVKASKEPQVEISKQVLGSGRDTLLSDEADNLNNAHALRASESQLWGRTSSQSDHHTTSALGRIGQSTVTGLKALLWPTPAEADRHTTFENSSSSQTLTTPQSTQVNPVEANQTAKADDRNSIFTIRSGNTPSRLHNEAFDKDMPDVEALAEEGEEGEDRIATASVAEGPSQWNRNQRKKLRRAENAMNTEETTMNKAPFDYANAPSILEEPSVTKKAISKSQRFDPYAKALDAPSGLKKARQPSGKSQTFHK